ncbi:MAG TPA: carboxypeptidase-like regulatory domain-containing protein, partial [Isosphaeraceae bacterium]|nr:carboxypeptidase-like regulatory domain-containing protein [Isosphaeraceae bacterium]
MNGVRAIVESARPGLRRAAVPVVLASSVIIAVALTVLVALSLAQGAGSRSNEIWRAHHEACHRIPEEVYHRDRFRALKGRVTDPDGQPIAGALVRCARLESLVELARGAPPLPSKWNVPIEAETRTDDRGRYEFPHLPVGGRTLFYSAPAGRDLAPAVKDLVVVQDGLGAQLDVTLARPATLTVRFRGPVKEWTRVYLVPERWWPGLESAKIPAGWRTAEFRRVGGPFRKGLIAATGWDESSPLRIVGRYDLDQSAEVVLAGHEMPVTRHDLPEAAGIEPWRFEPSTEERLFYAAMSPVPLFWRESPSGWPSWLPVPSFLDRLASLNRAPSGADPRLATAAGSGSAPQPAGSGRDLVGAGSRRRSGGPDGPDRRQEPPPTTGSLAAHQTPGGTEPANPQAPSLQTVHLAYAPPLIGSSRSATGIIRGFAPHAFLPVLVESHTAPPRLAWTSEASEFEVDGLPAGSYRVRALDLFGRVTFAAGVAVRPDRTAGPDEHVRLWSKIDLDEPDSRQVMGFLKWESGMPVAKAPVFMQCSYNFRKYVRHVEADDQGFFQFLDVPGNEPYFVFALPPGDENAMRSFEYFGVGHFQREVWRELSLHP